MEHLETTETVDTTLNIPVNRTTCVLFYFSRAFNLDFSYLYFLYKKFGEDVFYFFYMLSGKKISIPKEEKFIAMFQSADSVFEKITKNPDKTLTKALDLEVYSQLVDSLNNDTMEIEL